MILRRSLPFIILPSFLSSFQNPGIPAVRQTSPHALDHVTDFDVVALDVKKKMTGPNDDKITHDRKLQSNDFEKFICDTFIQIFEFSEPTASCDCLPSSNEISCVIPQVCIDGSENGCSGKVCAQHTVTTKFDSDNKTIVSTETDILYTSGAEIEGQRGVIFADSCEQFVTIGGFEYTCNECTKCSDGGVALNCNNIQAGPTDECGDNFDTALDLCPTESSSCEDHPLGWINSNGDGCEWYGVGDRCSEFGNSFENLGQTANEACCICGGGKLLPPLTWVGWSSCSPLSPCGECIGDCDTDHKCEGDLWCFHHDEREPVPGCTGRGRNEGDYCYDATMYGFPSPIPSAMPSPFPSSVPSVVPSRKPSTFPTSTPSSNPSFNPSSIPSSDPTPFPISAPSVLPSQIPSTSPTLTPSSKPSSSPSSTPSSAPTDVPSSAPSVISSKSHQQAQLQHQAQNLQRALLPFHLLLRLLFQVTSHQSFHQLSQQPCQARNQAVPLPNPHPPPRPMFPV